MRIECAGHMIESEEIQSYKLNPNFNDVVKHFDVVRLPLFKVLDFISRAVLRTCLPSIGHISCFRITKSSTGEMSCSE